MTPAMLGRVFERRAVLPLLALIVTALLARPFLLPLGKSHCAMTYMYPSYIDVSSIAGVHPVYSLFLYREGRPIFQDTRKVQSNLSALHMGAVVRQMLYLALNAEAAIQHATGVPVLFLHGSGGSYKQVSACIKPTQLQS